LLADLVADPGGAAALLPASSPHQMAGVRVLDLSRDPASPDAFAARLKASGGLAKPGQAGLRIGVLGPLTINGQPAALLPAQSQLIVALALHGDAGLSNKQLCGLLGADPGHPRPSDSLRQLIVRTRRQLGRASDGLEWIEHRGAGKYALHRAATVDWVEFEAITSRAIAARDADQLAAAMAMVRGQPFTGCYYWWLDYALVENVRARIVAAAETLGKLALAAGNPAQAARATRAGLVADEAAERLWRVLMRAEHAAGNMAGVREAWTRCLHAVADISADGQPERATVAVYHELGGR
jgi:DNA-binding SARP family transcriptional activator